MGTRELLDENILHWLDSIGIRAAEVVDKSWPRSDSHVFRLTESSGRQLYLKQFSLSAKFSNELRAYRDWLPQLSFPVPTLVAHDASLQRLLVTDAGQSVGDFSGLLPKDRHELMKRAGEFLRQLHNTEFVDDDPLALGDAFRLRAQRCRETLREFPASKSMVGLQAVEVAVAELEEVVSDLNEFQRVPCHRDFWQRNWVIPAKRSSDAAEMAVIDFEHAQPDLFLFDFMKMWSELWLDDRQLEEIFWASYGWMPDDRFGELMRRCGQLHALQTIAWACQNDDRFLAQGLRLLGGTLR